MRIAHISDPHVKPDAYELVVKSVDTIVAEHELNPFDLIAIPGDWWDAPIQNSERAMFALLVGQLKRLADCAPVVMIYGTPTHDAPGSLDILESIEAKYRITILRPGVMYGVMVTGENFRDVGEYDQKTHDMCGYDAILFGVPEPQKKWLLANQEATGKDASDEAVRNALRSLFLGLGGMRKEHSDLPCILLYHGDVYGATTAVGYSTASGSGIAASRDDLAAVGADYYALGHIHEPQEIPGLAGGYAGSMYPGSWGETHQAGFNVVEIDVAPDYQDLFEDVSGRAAVRTSRVNFPHARLAHIKMPWKLDPSTGTRGPEESAIAGRRVWLEWIASSTEESEIEPEVWVDWLTSHGALEGSKVTISIIPTETVRAAEIAEKKTLIEKIGVWAEASGVPVSESVLDKAREVEAEAARAGIGVVTDKSFRTLSTFLRGAWGFYYKQKKDEVFIDWEALGPGVVAYVGPNGFGKTTSFDFSKPWPIPVARPPKTLSKHFRLRDSCIENVYLEEVSGTRYKTRIEIAATLATPTAEYYLYRDSGNGWEPYPGVTGRQDDYVQAVDEVFGSMALYMRTAYALQSPTADYPDISRATVSEKKGIITELCGKGVDEYQAIAAEKRKLVDADLVQVAATIAAASDVDDYIERLQADIAEQEKTEVAANERASKQVELIVGFKARRDLCAERVANAARITSRLSAISAESVGLQESIRRAESDSADYEKALHEKPAAVEELATLEKLQVEIDALRAEKAQHDALQAEASAAYLDALKLHQETRAIAQGEVEYARSERANAERLLAALTARLSAPIEDHCPTCGQELPSEKRAALLEDRKALEWKIAEQGKIVDATKEAEGDALKALAAVDAATPKKPDPVPFPKAEALDAAIIALGRSPRSASACRSIIAAADVAALRIDEATKRRIEAQERIAALSREDADLRTESAEAGDVAAALLEAERDLEEAQRIQREASADAARARGMIDGATRAIADAQKRLDARDVARQKERSLSASLADWTMLERALAGVRDLELDALAPAISSIANELLAESGDTGRFRIDTTKISGKGSKTKQIEDFLIIYEGEAGEKDIAVCSGGEMVNVRKALYDAFSVIRAQNAGIKWATVLLDETDGALFPDAKAAYFRMLQKAHERAGRYQTILITQSAEIAAMATNTLDVQSLEAKRQEVAA